jgi:hypothetical protein
MTKKPAARASRGPTEIFFEVRVSSSRRGKSKLFDTYDTLGRAKRVALRLTEAGVPAAIVRVTRKIVWHHFRAELEKPMRMRQKRAERISVGRKKQHLQKMIERLGPDHPDVVLYRTTGATRAKRT